MKGTQPEPPVSFSDRSNAAMLGLALGDAFGRPLEFLRGHAVRTRPVDTSPGVFMWTDDTHMSIYLAEAVLAQGPDRLVDDAFGEAVGEAFSRWLDDPLTPSTAPGSTCTAGARNWRRTRDWRTSGVAASDGCGAVMRIGPIAIAFAGEELDRAARISALVTHGHENAVHAAIALARLVRSLLEGHPLNAERVEAALVGLPEAGDTARALRAGVRFASTQADQLDESAIPAGDGGWRSPSAVGLALAAALRWHDDVGLAIERAARIDGDSDSVAAITGLILGAARGTTSLPAPWVRALPERERLEQLATALAVRGQPWLVVADLHGRLAPLEAAIRRVEAVPHMRLCLLGDYVDNGPEIPALLDRILALKAAWGARLVTLAGNHDVTCTQALDAVGGPNEAYWAMRWPSHWNDGASTPDVYRAGTIPNLARKMPAAHRAFLRDLPWTHDTGRYLFVHAGMQSGPLGPQISMLAGRETGPEMYPEDGKNRGQPPHLRGKTLKQTEDPAWDRVVVTGHSRHIPSPCWEGRNRLALHATDRPQAPVYAVELPARGIVKAL